MAEKNDSVQLAEFQQEFDTCCAYITVSFGLFIAPGIVSETRQCDGETDKGDRVLPHLALKRIHNFSDRPFRPFITRHTIYRVVSKSNASTYKCAGSALYIFKCRLIYKTTSTTNAATANIDINHIERVDRQLLSSQARCIRYTRQNTQLSDAAETPTMNIVDDAK